MGALRWFVASALCIAVRGESATVTATAPATATVASGDSSGMGGRLGAPHLISSHRGGLSLGKWFYCLLGPEICSSSKTQLGWVEKRAGGMCLEGLVGLGPRK